jgi:iron complex transport system substrate-binding protein
MKKLSIAIMILIVTIFITGCGNATQSKDHQKSKTVSIKHTYEFKDKNNDHNRGTIKKETIEVPINPKTRCSHGLWCIRHHEITQIRR